MNIRQCPDCRGRGKFWRPPDTRTEYRMISRPGNSTESRIETVELPEYETCFLCGGVGTVECVKVAARAEKGGGNEVAHDNGRR